MSQGKTENRNLGGSILSGASGAWFPVQGPRQDGAETPRQVSCSGMGSGLSLGEVANLPCPSQVVLSESALERELDV